MPRILLILSLFLGACASDKEDSKMKLPQAPEFPEHTQWITPDNKAIRLADLKGYVVLLDFWTYGCINCMHVIPDLQYLEKKFAGQPLVVLGIHSAKFDNEKAKLNIKRAMQRLGVEHPVAVDSDFSIWKSYGVRAWPTLALITPDGLLAGKVSGEGHRQQLEEAIERILQEYRNSGELSPQIKNWNFYESHTESLKFPAHLSHNPEKNTLWLSDAGNHRLLELDLNSWNKEDSSLQVLTMVGSENAGLRNGPASEAEFRKPQGILWTTKGLYIADTDNHALRLWSETEQKVSTLIGNGNQGWNWGYHGTARNAQLNSPWGLAVDDSSLYIANAGNHQLWKWNIQADHLEAWCGNGRENIDDNRCPDATMAQPSGLFLHSGSLWLTDAESSSLRKVNLADQYLETSIGQGLFHFGHYDGPWHKALLQHPQALSGDGKSIYIADTYNHSIRHVDIEKESISSLPFEGACNLSETPSAECYPSLLEPSGILQIGDILWISDSGNHRLIRYDLKEQSWVPITITLP
jgi:thiol-disulfide isomerase/thioredoxin/sugar lactone lactonase YvrE